MAHLHMNCRSESLKMNTGLEAFLPEQVDLNTVPVIYLFHGLEDNYSGWGRYTLVEKFARMHGVAVIIPEVQRSFYTDMAMGVDYFTYVQQELPQMCQRFFNVTRDPSRVYVMGLSMGGYGALKCILTHPEQYAGCACFSAVTDIADRVAQSKDGERREFQAIFGTDLQVPSTCNLFHLAPAVPQELKPKIAMYCGESDDLYPQNQAFAALLKKEGYDMSFEHWAGNHDWDFWNPAVQKGMARLFASEGSGE